MKTQKYTKPCSRQKQYFHSLQHLTRRLEFSINIKKKSSSICDLVISKHLDVLAITETWLTGKSWNSTVAEILNTLKGYEFYDVSRVRRTGGGEGVFLHRLERFQIESILFTSMEYLDLDISYGNSTSRVVTTNYRPPRSKKNCSTQATFFST